MKVIYNNKEVANTTLNYNELFNKPLLNSHELVGNTSLNDIGVYSKPQVDNLIASTRSIKVVSALPTPLVANTMYYVGPDQNNLYHIYLVDSSLTLIDLGMSQDAVYLGGNGIDISSDNEISVVFDNETLMLNSEGELYVRPATENVYGSVKYDNTTIKKNNSGKIYVNNSNTIVNITDADKIGMTQAAIQKYTDTLAKHVNTGATAIPTNSDLNTAPFTAVGNYYVRYNSDAASLSNCPTGNAFCMVVKNVVNSDVNALGASLDGSRVREIITYKDERWTQNVIYTVSSGTITYSTWKRVLDNSTLSDTIVGTTDADKIALTKNAVQKYTDTLVKHADTGAIGIPTTGGVDLNSSTYTAVGNYYTSGNFTASNIANCPTNGHAFQMTVRNPISADVGEISNYTYRVRDIITYTDERWTQRISKSDSDTYYGIWQRVPFAGTDTVGNRCQPVYLKDGTITAVESPNAGSYFNTVPFIRTSGIMDIGRGFDFHGTSTTTASTEGSLSLNTTTGDLQWVNRMTSGSSRDGIVLTSGMMSSMPEVIEVNAVTSGTVTTWKGNSYGVSVAENGAGLTSGASGVKRVKGTLALRWTDVQNPTYIALAPVSGDDNYFKFMSGLNNMGAAITPSMVTSPHNYTWATASFNWGTVRQSTVWYDAVRTSGNTWHIDFTISINGSQACLSGTVISNNIAADATPKLYIGNVAANPANVTCILEIYR